MDYPMLPKHYEGFAKAFPEASKEDFEKLFKAGLHTPGHVKAAQDEKLREVLGLTRAKKVRKTVK